MDLFTEVMVFGLPIKVGPISVRHGRCKLIPRSRGALTPPLHLTTAAVTFPHICGNLFISPLLYCDCWLFSGMIGQV